MNFGIIADGNRRWAKTNNLPVKDGHQAGFLAIKNEILPILKSSKDFDGLVVYGFSTENWKRSPLEINNLMKLFIQIMTDWEAELIADKIRIIHAGRRDRLPAKLLDRIDNLSAKTQDFREFTIYFCLDYSSQDELVRTFQNLDNKKISRENFTKRLEVPTLDLILRTGGDFRLSNFCLWQSAYAELFFHSKLLPDIKKSDIEQILKDFNQRQRRLGQ
jgi:undecaprenyl diphosphate synthase